jgi:hypothetical protein
MQIGEKIVFDRYLWRVLDIQSSAALLITEDIVELRPYHNKYKDTTWHDCAARHYLNGEFYDQFDEANKSRILEVTIKNPDNPWYGTHAGEETQDSIFLLDLDEVCRYFGDSTHLLYHKGNNPYWKKNDVNNPKRRAKYTDFYAFWWLRSPGRNNHVACYVHGTDGCVAVNGNNVTNPYGGLRPALWLKL